MCRPDDQAARMPSMKLAFVYRIPLLFFALVLAAPWLPEAHADSSAKAGAKNTLPLAELHTFVEVMQKIKQDYVEPVSDKRLLQNAINGMLTGLDPHSAYLDATQYKQLKINTSGRFGGLGIVVAPDKRFIKVVSPIDGTPAQRAGIHSGDVIVRINGESVEGMKLDQAVKRMRGAPGTSIELEIIRPGHPTPLRFTLKREIIRVDSVKSRLLEPGYGYVRIASFQSATSADLRKALAKLKKTNKAPLRGLVLDLRNNPGGLLNAAVSVSNTFLSRGLIVYIKGRIPDSSHRFEALPGDALSGAPIVALVNGGTASAAEIVAGALKDNHRALVVGTRTFGKGSVQTVLPLSQDTAIKLTTALYYTPNGHSIQAEGIRPDITVEPLQVKAAANPRIDSFREADLSGHLKNPGAAKLPHSGGKNDELALAHKDFQLYEALTVLKSLALARPPATAG